MAEERTQPSIRKIGLAKPIEVRMGSGDKVFFVTLYKNGDVEIRPRHSRDPDAVAVTTIEAVYKKILMSRVAPIKKSGRKRTMRRSSML